MKKSEVKKPGKYEYTRPGWDGSVEVEVLEDMSVRFRKGYAPVKWADIPEDSQLELKD